MVLADEWHKIEDLLNAVSEGASEPLYSQAEEAKGALMRLGSAAVQDPPMLRLKARMVTEHYPLIAGLCIALKDVGHPEGPWFALARDIFDLGAWLDRESTLGELVGAAASQADDAGGDKT